MTLSTIESTALSLLESTDLALGSPSPESRDDVRRGASELARIFAVSVVEIRSHWGAIVDRCGELDRLMTLGRDDPYPRNDFNIRLQYDGSHSYGDSGKPAIDAIIAKMNVKVWSILADRLGIKNLMSIKRRPNSTSKSRRAMSRPSRKRTSRP